MISRAVWKHGPRESVDKNRGRRPMFLSLLRPDGHVLARSLIDFFPCSIHINMKFSALKWAILAHFMVAMEIALLLWTGYQGTQKNNCHENLYTCFTALNGI